MDQASYQHLRFEHRSGGVLLITIDRVERMNATDAQLHTELATVWNDVARDGGTHVAVITGAGRAFSAGGDLEMIEQMAGPHPTVPAMAGEAAQPVPHKLHRGKPAISTIHGAP